MQAVILAAGRGMRMKELTEELPKVLLEVGGKTLLEYKFDALPYDIDEIILVVGYKGSLIHDRFGGIYKDKKILYVEQEVLDGTAGALWRARDLLHDDFIVMMGDDIYSKEDADRCIAIKGWTMLVQEVQRMGMGGRIVTDESGAITDIVEGDHGDQAGLVNTNLFALDPRIFDRELVPKAPGSTEFGLPQTVLAASKKSGIPLQAVKATKWIQITDAADLEKAQDLLAKSEV